MAHSVYKMYGKPVRNTYLALEAFNFVVNKEIFISRTISVSYTFIMKKGRR